MKIIIDEFVTGGGLLASACSLESLINEGLAMADAVADDFSKLPAAEVILTRDARLPETAVCIDCSLQWFDSAWQREDTLSQLYSQVDWTIVIAPEIDGELFRQAENVVRHGGKLLGPTPAMIKVASDKQRCAEFLTDRRVPVPVGFELKPNEIITTQALPGGFKFPAVVKPIDGAGSMQLQKIHSVEDFRACDYPVRIENFQVGVAASVAVLAGSKGLQLLEPCYQQLSDDGNFKFLGGRLPLGGELSKRAIRLAEKVAACFSDQQSYDPRGYYGIDMILGTAEDGSDDVVLEVNPRLTTSYIALRKAYPQNLAEAMLATAEGKDFPLNFNQNHIQFKTDGTVDICRMGACTHDHDDKSDI